MKKTGAVLLSIILIIMMTVTNLAGAYHSAARVYAAEETVDGAGSSDSKIQGVDETASANNDELPTGDEQQSGNQQTTITPPQDLNAIQQPQGDVQTQDTNSVMQGDNTRQEALVTTLTVTFEANGHGTAPDAVTVESGQTIAKPADPAAEGYTFTGWFRDTTTTIAWNFDADTVSENMTLYAGWVENPPAQTAEASASQNNTLEQLSNDTGNTGSTAQNGSAAHSQPSSDASNSGLTTQSDSTTTPQPSNDAS